MVAGDPDEQTRAHESDPLIRRTNKRIRERRAESEKEKEDDYSEYKRLGFPWILFVCICLVFTLCYHRASGFLTCLTLLALAVLIFRFLVAYGHAIEAAAFLFNYLPKNQLSLHFIKDFVRKHHSSEVLFTRSPGGDYPPRLLLAAILAVVAGAGVGYFNYAMYTRDYWHYFEGRHYTNVWPEEPAAAHADASALVFAKGSRPDAAHTGGLEAGGHTFCVAPVHIAGPTSVASSRVEYWAIGKDCCRSGVRRGNDPGEFTCGDASDAKARAGLVVPNRPDGYILEGTSLYAKAAKMAAAQYGLKTAADPLWVVWTSDLDSANSWRIGHALLDILYAALLALPLLVVVEFGMARKLPEKSRHHVFSGTHAFSGKQQSNENAPLFQPANVGHQP